jgi:hypothetical protein
VRYGGIIISVAHRQIRAGFTVDGEEGRGMPPPTRRRVALIAVPLLAIGVGAGAFAAHGSQQASAPTPAVPTIDSRLILRPHNVPVHGTMVGGAVLSGSIYPGIPYRTNTIQLTLTRGGHTLAATGGASLSVSMVGMQMLPVKAVLHPAGSGYSGTLYLPMFGSYRGPITVATSSGSLTGTIEVTAPLPGE